MTDAKIVEKAVTSFSRLVDCARGDSEKLSRLASGGLVPALVTLLTTKPRPVSASIFTTIIKTLNNLVAYVDVRSPPSLVVSVLSGLLYTILLRGWWLTPRTSIFSRQWMPCGGRGAGGVRHCVGDPVAADWLRRRRVWTL